MDNCLPQERVRGDADVLNLGWDVGLRGNDQDVTDDVTVKGRIGVRVQTQVASPQYGPVHTRISNMSLVGVHPRELRQHHGSLSSLSYSLDDITGCCSPQFNSEHVMTIEELRLQMSSCFTCGVSWVEDHVSLDCSECGGYALARPCPSCDGSCGAVWKRDLNQSHASRKAQWNGECSRSSKQQPAKTFAATTTTTQELCSKLEKLSSHS